eukprot:scaffold634907_cov19-Prasinocladus_malaysianus.AAC.1
MAHHHREIALPSFILQIAGPTIYKGVESPRNHHLYHAHINLFPLSSVSASKLITFTFLYHSQRRRYYLHILSPPPYQ